MSCTCTYTHNVMYIYTYIQCHVHVQLHIHVCICMCVLFFRSMYLTILFHIIMLSLQQSGCVFYSRQKTAPSIPFPGQSYGYEEDNSGQLQPQLLPDRDKTMGPAYYNVSHVRCIFVIHIYTFVLVNHWNHFTIET